MEVTVRKAGVAGNVRVPSSKSILQRYLIAGLLADGITELKDVSHCRDTLSCLSAIRNLSLQPAEEKLLRIAGCNGNIRPHTESINCGESGFALRALSAVAALSATRIVLNGVGSLLSRPVDFFEKVFSELDVECRTNHGFLPVSLKGPVHFRNITVDGSVSSQFLSGLLMVFPLAEKDHVIEVTNLKSKLYVDLTLQVMKEFGVSVTHENYKRFYIQGNQQYKACTEIGRAHV